MTHWGPARDTDPTLGKAPDPSPSTSSSGACTLRLDLNQVRAEAVSAVDGFHLRDLVRADAALAAVSGSFSFISDDPSYQPAEHLSGPRWR